jgi:hypothetical protein
MPCVCWWDTAYRNYVISTPEQEANYCCQMFTTAEGMKGVPGGCFDRNYWWHLRGDNSDQYDALWGIDGNNPNVPLWAFKQSAEQLVGKRFNGRVMTGDSVTDAQVRLYEFENPAISKKTWVCWRSGGTQLGTVQLPVRADTVSRAALNYGEGPSPDSLRQANSLGWLGIGVGDRPQFVTEPASDTIKRPDLAVDSFQVGPPTMQIGKGMGFTAFVKNYDNVRATPDTVWYKFYRDTTLVESLAGPRIKPCSTCVVGVVGYVVPASVYLQ